MLMNLNNLQGRLSCGKFQKSYEILYERNISDVFPQNFPQKIPQKGLLVPPTQGNPSFGLSN